MNPGSTVFLVDDEPGMLKALGRLLLAEGFAVRAYPSAEEFLRAHQATEAGCLVLDIAMPGIDGLELQQRLTLNGSRMSIIFLTGHGDIPMSVRAIKAGAIDFLTKPVNDAQLLTAIRSALSKTEEKNKMIPGSAVLRERLDQLTRRERQVFDHVIAGKTNKRIANELFTGEQNIKVHRRRVMDKMCAGSLAELVRMAERLELPPAY